MTEAHRKGIKWRTLLLFVLLLGGLVGGSLAWLQSRSFANWVKTFLVNVIPASSGIRADFEEFEIGFLPPSVSIRQPRLQHLEKKVHVTAEKVQMKFYPLQILTGAVAIREVTVIRGDVDVAFNPDALKSSPQKAPRTSRSLRWEDLFQVRVDQVGFRDTMIRLKAEGETPVSLQFEAERLAFRQEFKKGESQLLLDLKLRNFKADAPADLQIPRSLEEVSARASIMDQQIQIESVELSNPGLHANLKGVIRGNILNPRKLILDSQLELRGQIETILAGIPNLKPSMRVQGEIDFRGAIKGDLLTLGSTFDANGIFRGQRVVLGPWYFENATAEGRWKSAARQDDMVIAVKSALIQAPMVERAGGRPASGGEIEFDAFDIPLNVSTPVDVSMRLKQAHIHWLVAGAIEDVFALDFRSSGSVRARFTPPAGKQSWKLDAQVDLAMPSFQLDNQRFGKIKPLSRVVATKDLHLKASVQVNDRAVRIDQATLKIAAASKAARTEFLVKGSIDFKTGYDLRSEGKVDFSDLTVLAENQIRGVGTLATEVKGPGKRVWIHFFPKLAHAEFLNLKLGQVQGEIAYDDGPHDLHFKQINLGLGNAGMTQVLAHGKIALDDPEEVDLLFKVRQGDIHDVLSVFERLTEKQWWFPSSFFGAVQGQIHVGGGLSMSKLKIAAQLAGVDWDYYGEKFRNVQLNCGYHGGRYSIQDWTLTKGNGRIQGQLNYRENETFQWSLETQGLVVNDLDHVARLDVPIRGQLGFSSQGKLNSDRWIVSRTTAELSQLSVRGIPFPDSNASVDSQNGLMRGRAKVSGQQAEVSFEVPSRPQRPSYFKADFDQLDLSALLLLINSKLMSDTELAANVTGRVDIQFPSGMADRFSGNIRLDALNVAKHGTLWELIRPFKIESRNGTFAPSVLALKSRQGEAQISIGANEGLMRGGISGVADLGLVEFLTSSIQRAEGPVNMDLVLSGSLLEPKITGRMGLRNGRLQLESMETPIESLRGVLVVKQNTIAVQDFNANLAKGGVTANGKVVLLPQPYPELDLSFEFEDAVFKLFPFQNLEASGALGVRGNRAPYLVQGNVQVLHGFSKEKLTSQNKNAGRRSARFTPTFSGAQRNVPLFELDLETHAENGVFLKNDLFDVELKGDVQVTGTFNDPKLFGKVDLVRGSMSFRDRVFQVQTANLQFDNPHVFNPLFSVVARTELPKAKIEMIASGRRNQMKLEFTSDPVMAESEILSLLALGFTSEDLRRLRADDRSAIQQGEAAATIFQALEFNKDVQEKTGLELQLQQSVSTQTGQSIFRQQTQSDAGASPKLVIKRKVNEQVDVSVGSTVGVGSTTEREGRVEVHVTPGVSVIGIWNNFEGNTLQENTTSYGLDIKLQRRFK